MSKLGRTSKIASVKRVSRTKLELLDAGRALFAERPVDAVAIDDIVNQANVGKGSFYNHFSDKDSFLDAIVADIRTRLERRVRELNSDIEDPAARIVRALSIYALSASDQPMDGQILVRNDQRSWTQRSLNKGLAEDLAAGLHSGRLIFPSISAATLFIVGLSYSLLLAALRRQDAVDALPDISNLCMLMLRAFGLPNGEAELMAAQATDAIYRSRPFSV